MAFRCPYCKKDLGEKIPAKCPGCGKAVIKSEPAAVRIKRIAKKRAIENIRAAADREASALAPGLQKRGLVYYLCIIGVLAALGVALVGSKVSPGRSFRDGNVVRAQKNIDALAVALGRFKFHTGRYPTTEEGLRMLTWAPPPKQMWRRPPVRGYLGPYLMQRKLPRDPWHNEYVYEMSQTSPDAAASSNTSVQTDDAVPVLYSCGPDGKPFTADDIKPAAQLFTEPFRDTVWTNGWVPWIERGHIIIDPRAANGG